MQSVAVAALLVIAFILNPAIGIAAAFLYLARRHVATYVALWRRLVQCEVATPLVAAMGFLSGLLSPYAGVAKIILVTMGLSSLYLAPVMPRISRVVSIVSTGLSIDAPLKPLILASAVAAAFVAYKADACGYICQKTPVLPVGEFAYVPSIGVVCIFEKGGWDLSSVVLQLNNRHIKCSYGICSAVDREVFLREVGTVDRYLPRPSPEDFKGVIHVVAPPHIATKIVGKYFDTVVAIGSLEARQVRLTAISKTRPDVVASVFGAVFKLSGDQMAFLKDLLTRGSKEEVLAWSLKYPWLRSVAELWEGGDEPSGIVKSVLTDSVGLVDSLLYAYTKAAPVLTDNEDVAAIARKLGLLVFFISSVARDNFIVVGPASLETPEGSVEVGPGRFIARLAGLYFSDNFKKQYSL
jgi:hypothetical protein